MDLLKNPFYILTAHPHDNRRRIIELADERSLVLGSTECIEARSELTNPRKRLSAEVAWLLGLSPKRVSELLGVLEASPSKIIDFDKLLPLTRANLLTASLIRLSEYTHHEVVKWILEITWAFEKIDLEELRIIIDTERTVSGFPEITDLSGLEAEIKERRLYFRKSFKSALNNLDAKELVESVTMVVESATNKGKEYTPILIADLIEAYEVEVQNFFEKEEKNIKFLVDQLQKAIENKYSDTILFLMLNQLIRVVKNWDFVAQPIQLRAKSQGLDHRASHYVANYVRNLAVYLCNRHNKLDFSIQITQVLQEVFAEVGEISEQLNEDAKTLEKLKFKYN